MARGWADHPAAGCCGAAACGPGARRPLPLVRGARIDAYLFQALMDLQPPSIPAGIRSACGRAKYLELASRPGLLARLRLAWFVAIATLRDRSLPVPE
jgi:hypothetical protein